MTKNLDHPTKPIKPFNNNTLMNRLMKFNSNHPVKKSKNPLIITLLSIIVIIIVSGGYFGYKHSANSNEELFNSYFKCHNIIEDKFYVHMQAIKEYNAGDFEKAIEYFTDLSQNDTVLGAENFYLALSYIKCEQYNNAIEILDKLSQDDKNYYKIESHWYLGLSYLRIHKDDNANKHFLFLLGEGKKYKKDAEEILKKMKN